MSNLSQICLTLQQCKLPHGRVLGGGSSVNGMVYVRGSRHDFDQWAKDGCDGWSYQDVLPYFKKAEHMHDDKMQDQGKDMKMTVSLVSTRSVILLQFKCIKAFKKMCNIIHI